MMITVALCSLSVSTTLVISVVEMEQVKLGSCTYPCFQLIKVVNEVADIFSRPCCQNQIFLDF